MPLQNLAPYGMIKVFGSNVCVAQNKCVECVGHALRNVHEEEKAIEHDKTLIVHVYGVH